MTDKSEKSLAPTGEFLLFQSDDGRVRVQVRLQDDTVWLTQRQMAELYGTSIPNINQHIAAVYDEGELIRGATLKQILIIRREGSRQVTRSTDHYSLPVIVAVGYRVRSAQGTAFRQWATELLQQYLIKGFVMNDERLKSGAHLDSIAGPVDEPSPAGSLDVEGAVDVDVGSTPVEPDEPIPVVFIGVVPDIEPEPTVKPVASLPSEQAVMRVRSRSSRRITAPRSLQISSDTAPPERCAVHRPVPASRYLCSAAPHGGAAGPATLSPA